MSKRLILLRVEFWWWLEHRVYMNIFGKSPYERRKRAERDMIERHGCNIYGEKLP